MKEAIRTPAAPTPVGPYSQAIRCGHVVHLAGQIALDPGTGAIVDGGPQDHARQAFSNLQEVARAAGGSLEDAVKITLYLTNMEHFAEVNVVCEEFFSEPWPARSTIAALALPRGSLVEVDAVMIVE